MPRGNKVYATRPHTKHFVCECGYYTLSETGTRLHYRVTHGTDLKDLDKPDTPRHGCIVCKEDFDNGSQLLTHLRHTGHVNQ